MSKATDFKKIVPAIKYFDYAIMNEIECYKVTDVSPRNSDGIYNEWDDKKILEFTSAEAAFNLSETDSVNGMKSGKEIEKICETFERRTDV